MGDQPDRLRFSVGLVSAGLIPTNPSKNRGRRVGTTGTVVATFEGTSFVCGQSAPDPVVLAGLHGSAQPGLNDLTATADGFCFFELAKCRVAVPEREEQLGVHVQAGSTITPRHQDRAP